MTMVSGLIRLVCGYDDNDDVTGYDDNDDGDDDNGYDDNDDVTGYDDNDDGFGYLSLIHI